MFNATYFGKTKRRSEIIWMDRFSCASSVFEKALMSTPAAWLTATNLNSGNKTVFKRTFSLAERLKQRATFSQLWLTVYSKYKLFKNSNVIQTNWNQSFIMAGIYLYGFMISADILQLTLADCRYVHILFSTQMQRTSKSPEVELTYYYNRALTEADAQCFSNWEKRPSQQFAN